MSMNYQNIDRRSGLLMQCSNALGIVDAPKHNTPRLLINYDLVGSFGSRPKDSALLGDIVQNLEQLAKVLDWSEDLLEAQVENELNMK